MSDETTEKPMPLALELVNEFVMVSHGNLARVKELLAQDARLIHAAWDWGGGDFETALGAAAHVGNQEIARFLLANGARMDLFAAAMLGELQIVQSLLTTFPEQAQVLGPHKIPLILHARAGKAEEVVRYLESL
jgi:hypothetical protein